jgi:outer membrane protein OmpA-like peptidoglycan-associated protein
MQAITAKRVLIVVVAVFSLTLMVGCSGMKKRPAYRGGYLYYPTALVNADRALDEAIATGKDKECQAEFDALKNKVNKAYEVYMACHTKEAIGMAQEATGEIEALCPAKPVAEMKPEPKAERVVDRLTVHVNFDFNESTIREADDAELQKAIDFVRKYPDARIELDGYTDDKGTAQYNQELSEKRAEAVKQYLIEKGGVDEARISTKGYGESNPIAPNRTEEGKDNPEGRAENRRVEILIISE